MTRIHLGIDIEKGKLRYLEKTQIYNPRPATESNKASFLTSNIRVRYHSPSFFLLLNNEIPYPSLHHYPYHKPSYSSNAFEDADITSSTAPHSSQCSDAPNVAPKVVPEYSDNP